MFLECSTAVLICAIERRLVNVRDPEKKKSNNCAQRAFTMWRRRSSQTTVRTVVEEIRHLKRGWIK